VTKVFRKRKGEENGNFVRKYTNFTEWQETAVLTIKAFPNNKLVVVKKDVIEVFHFNHRLGFLKTSGKIPFEFAKVRDRKFNVYKKEDTKKEAHKLNWVDCGHKVLRACIEISNNGKRVYYGGFFNGNILVYKWENKQTDTFNGHSDTVTCLAVDNEEYYLASGSRAGEVVLWRILPEDSKCLEIEKSWIDHEDEVTG
jgi:WD40 repeat protein